MKKFILSLLVVLLTMYAPIELTRMLLLWTSRFGYAWEYLYEIPFIWAAYGLAMVLFAIIIWTRWEDK